MDWKLILQLSLFGLAMGIATVFWIPSNIEPLFWLGVLVICAYIISKKLEAKHFVHGLLLGLANSVWVTGSHILFFNQYIANHPREAAMMNSMPMPASPRAMMALMGPIIGLISGLVLGLLALIAHKVVPPSRSA